MSASLKTLGSVLIATIVLVSRTWAQDSPYEIGRELIRAGDRTALEAFLADHRLPIRMPEPVDLGPDYYPEPLVVEAIRAGRPDMVDAFLASGLPVGTGATRDGRSVFDLLMEEHDPSYLELAATYVDDRGVVTEHFTRQLRRAVETGLAPTPAEVRRWVQEWNVSFDPGLAVGVLAMGRNRELSEVLIARTPGIELFDPVARFVAERPDMPGEYIDISVERLASSFLPGEEEYYRYHIDAAFDGDLTTSWVEGRRDGGLGDSVLYRLPRREGGGASELSFFPGYGEAQSFARYNRIRRARIEWYISDTMDSPFGRGGAYRRLHLSETVTIPDEFAWVTVAAPEAVMPNAERSLPSYVRIVIEEVYPGSDRNDTCIAEIAVHAVGERP